MEDCLSKITTASKAVLRLKSFFTREFRLTFAGALYALLQEPKSIRCWPAHQNCHRARNDPTTLVVIKGRRPLRQHREKGETVVGIELVVWPDWMRSLPLASTDAPFLRAERDWHVPKKPYICYALNEEWRWKLDELWNNNAGSDTIITVSSSWCIRNIDSLITRHLHGARGGITRWPKAWGQWSHGADGIREFEEYARNLEAA